MHINTDLEDAFVVHDWPGNVRELKNTIEKIRLFRGDKTEYTLADLLNILPQWNYRVRPTHAAKQRKQPAVEPSEPPRVGNAHPAPNLQSKRSQLRMEETVLQMFRQYGKLTRKELISELQIASDTATRYLQRLIRAGHIEKIEPSRSHRSHYFQLVNK